VNDDALAAVIAAAQLLLARRAAAPAVRAGAGWAAAARVRVPDAGRARLVARRASRWMMSGRLRE
jgi:hypothetical protein